MRFIFKKSVVLLSAALMLPAMLNAQLKYHDASEFPLYGKATEATANRYTRLPDSLANISRGPLWNLGRNSTGMAVRFRSNSPTIAAKWKNTFNKRLPIMTETAIKGLDLYALENGEWKFVNSARPGTGIEHKTTIIANMDTTEREYMLYTPLHDGLASLEIGIDSAAFIAPPAVESPRRGKPVVFYGTSILQGIAVSRPGMAATNILSRWLNRETINLAFSGNAFLDLEIAGVIAGVDAACFVLDFVPNASVDMMNSRMEKFYRIIREKHPKTPIIFIEDPIFPHSKFDQRIAKQIADKNETVRRIFNELVEKGEKNIYFVPSTDMIGADGEATVDGVHFTDLGTTRYSELLYPMIKKFLKDSEDSREKPSKSHKKAKNDTSPNKRTK